MQLEAEKAAALASAQSANRDTAWENKDPMMQLLASNLKAKAEMLARAEEDLRRLEAQLERYSGKVEAMECGHHRAVVGRRDHTWSGGGEGGGEEGGRGGGGGGGEGGE
eukprot:GHVU01179063.1.p3 GENE.GHVU01179063.1~~GHVU01179063.1.p3  ORF type:complete len:109 (-),score=44.65 GHVU01179063.1:338-664(-)